MERTEGSAGREVRYRLRPGALHPTAAWLAAAESAWEGRLGRLKRSVEDPPAGWCPDSEGR